MRPSQPQADFSRRPPLTIISFDSFITKLISRHDSRGRGWLGRGRFSPITPAAALITARHAGGPTTLGTGHIPPVIPSSTPMPMPNPKQAPSPQQKPVIPPPGSTLVNSGIPSPSLGGGGKGKAPVLRFNGYGEYAGLLYHSPHSVVYEEDLYPTALHLFEARKFLDHRPDLAEAIRRCERVEDVTALSAQVDDFKRLDWGNVALITVSDRVSHRTFFGLTCADSEGGYYRWTMCYTSSSGSTETCVLCFSIPIPPISCMSSRKTRSGEMVQALG